MAFPGQSTLAALFDRLAAGYDGHAVLEQEVGLRLLERLAFQKRALKNIIDLGSGTGYGSAALKRRFRQAQVIGLDISQEMGRQLRRRSTWLRPLQPVCGDLSSLPFASHSADLLFSNLAIQWCDDFAGMVREFRRILRPDGLLLFSSLGPQSLREFRLLEQEGLPPGSLRNFVDMHEMGDALLAEGFAQPVVDSELITTEYRSIDLLLGELEASGAHTHLSNWGMLVGQAAALGRAYRTLQSGERLPVTWEIVYGTAFGPEEGQPLKTGEGDIATFSVDFLRKSLKR